MDTGDEITAYVTEQTMGTFKGVQQAYGGGLETALHFASALHVCTLGVMRGISEMRPDLKSDLIQLLHRQIENLLDTGDNASGESHGEDERKPH